MKKSFFLVLILSLFLLEGFKKADPPIALHVTVSNDVCQSGQWVYWFSLNANEYNIEDSCYLPKGQHSFTMKKVIPDENDEMGSWLTFSKHGPLQAWLYLSKGENVKLTINKKWITKTEGSPETEEWYDYIHKMLNIGKKIQSLTKASKVTKDSLTRSRFIDSIHYLKNVTLIKTRIEAYSDFNSPKMFLMQIRVPGLPQKTVDSLVKVMKQRFPNDKRVQEYPWHPKYSPSSQHSDWVHYRLLEIWTKRTGMNYQQPVPKLSAEQKKELRQNKMLILGK